MADDQIKYNLVLELVNKILVNIGESPINELDQFAKLLASKNKHGVPYEVIKDMIQKWHHNPQIDEI